MHVKRQVTTYDIGKPIYLTFRGEKKLGTVFADFPHLIEKFLLWCKILLLLM